MSYVTPMQPSCVTHRSGAIYTATSITQCRHVDGSIMQLGEAVGFRGFRDNHRLFSVVREHWGQVFLGLWRHSAQLLSRRAADTGLDSWSFPG